MKSHHENRLRPTTSVRDSYASPSCLAVGGTFQPVPAPKKPKSKPAPSKKKGKR